MDLGTRCLRSYSYPDTCACHCSLDAALDVPGATREPTPVVADFRSYAKHRNVLYMLWLTSGTRDV